VYLALVIAQVVKAPKHIAAKLLSWIDIVEEYGLSVASKIKRHRYEPLKGKCKGELSMS
jgi:hypothetical protein